MDRRRFLKWAGALGVGLTPLVFAAPVRERILGKSLASASQTRPHMGTVVTVTILHPSAEKAREAMEDAFAEMERLIPLLDRHAPDTPVSRLNHRGILKDAPPELLEVMDQARRIHRLTRGAFDISVKPVLDLFEDSFSRNQSAPSEEEIGRALRRVGAEHIRCGEKQIQFFREGMEISLDGIAKGYIVEKVVSRLKSGGIRHALINAGGDILALGDKGNGQPWRIAIQDPRERNQVLQIIPLRDGAVATSGDYENFFDGERKYHHIIDPHTGHSPQQVTSVSVRARSLTLADALATAAFIPPREEARAFLRAIPGTEALWVDRKKVQMNSEGWERA
ncbi:MAG: FAD:protein FMN transferase [Syntrophaceae bacterium]|nr:FAD:protein FMN transferase [Syntrophaceae bacterium]